MTSYSRYLMTCLISVSLTYPATAQSGLIELVKVPPAPSNLQVPAGNTAYLKAHAIGTQNYICRTTDTGFAWTLFGPQATLFLTFKWFLGDVNQQIMTHFLSPNPMEGGTPRATWQSSLDTSAVWARAIQTSSDPSFVVSGAIPWLLLEVVGNQRGPSGGSTLTATTYIQRLNTFGGVAPATGCSQSDVGNTILVPYSTDYFFYRAGGHN